MSPDETAANAFTTHSFAPPPAASQAATGRERTKAFSDAVETLHELTHAGLEDVNECLHETVTQLSKLADAVESSLTDFNDDQPEVKQLLDFVVDNCQLLRQAAMSEAEEEVDEGSLEFLREEIELRLDSCDAAEGGQPAASWEAESNGEAGHDAAPETDLVAPSQEEIAALLSGLSAQLQAGSQAEPGPDGDTEGGEEAEGGQRPTSHAADPAATRVPTAPPQVTGAQATEPPTETHADDPGGIAPPPRDEGHVDEELREAFMDDAGRGLESMEQALLDLESNPADPAPVKTIGRELHTIKGASASIGMAHLAAYIHEVEELIRRTQESGQAVTPELLLPHVDLIRARVEGSEDPAAAVNAPAGQAAETDGTGASAIDDASATASMSVPAVPGAVPAPGTHPAPESAPVSGAPPVPGATRPVAAGGGGESHGEDETVRVKASQLNRLMDMLSELVMLRNQRDTEISELKGIHDELIHSVTRIRMLSHEGEALLAGNQLANPTLAEEGVSFSHLNEVANDVLESAQRLRDCYRPVDEGNQAVSQFIRNFRLELVQLRRMPVSGLFRRLHRAISDAARTEKKQVRVELIGEHTGIERSLQERIFEPLLHIVRNSVSHGIEAPEERIAAGKNSQGVVTLQAHSGPDLLVIEVRDDGRGLDYDAIRRRGVERGLIDADKSISRAELARLIFHPGFSTRQTANQISGRGVGMDVVASTLERMRGWVEVESEHGHGSMIRLSLPLPSMIQHVMVFRSGGQLFALPAQAVRRTGHFDAMCSPVDINEVLELKSPEESAGEDPFGRAMIEMAGGTTGIECDAGGEFALLVDRVLGPEEVVVRPMPMMLKSHPLCMGATLSGMGEVVLLLDPRAVAEAAKGTRVIVQSAAAELRVADHDQPKVLVVDDSKSARLRLVRALDKYPVTVVEAEDGQAALELMARESFATVFSDIDMPRMSGLELLRTIKGEPRLESIPVIVISSRSIETAGTQACKLGARCYVQKPLNPERLQEVVCELDWANP